MRSRPILALANFLSVSHFYLVTYILGPYIGTLLPDALVGVVVAIGAVVTLTIFPYVPRILRITGVRHFTIIVGIIQAALLLLLATMPSPIVALLTIALTCAFSPFIAYALDLLLEATVKSEAGTGKIRTAFLTAGNIPLLVAPILIALLLDSGSAYENVFLLAGLSLVPFVLLMSAVTIPEGEPPRYHRLRDTLRCCIGNKDLTATLLANYLLQVFYHLAPLYISLYLFGVLNIPWDTLGWMFAVMLIPFVLIEYPAGVEGDKHGDKALMALGFLTMGIGFALIGFLAPDAPLLTVLILLIGSRVGAALVEAMTEGHFFRSVSERDATTVELFRMMRPIAALTAPLLGSMILFTGGYAVLFFATGTTIAVVGLATALRIRDVRHREVTPSPAKA